jgi:hypothetical protein
MKKLNFQGCILLCILAAILTITGCSKSNSGNNNTNTLPSQPEAKVSFDNQSGGIYKGTLTGSSGYFKVNLQATKPFIIYQWTDPAGSMDSLFTNDLNGWTSGQAISHAAFSAADGSLFWFSVNANGANPSIDSVFIPGHPTKIYTSIAKETSQNQVKLYQGRATLPIPQPNCVNITVNLWTGSGFTSGFSIDDHGFAGIWQGPISGNQINFTATPVPPGVGGGTGTLTISSDGNSISGTGGGGGCGPYNISLSRIL